MKVQIYSDTICPWCWVGKRRLKAALSQRPNLAPAIQWQPFQLNPDMASEGADRGEYIRAKFGPGGYGQMAEALVEIGHSVGIDFDFDRPGRVPNTIDSHRLMGLAGSAGLQEELSEVMFRQYFGEGLDIGDAAILAAAGAEAGLDLAAMKALLEPTKAAKRSSSPMPPPAGWASPASRLSCSTKNSPSLAPKSPPFLSSYWITLKRRPPSADRGRAT